MKRGTDTEGHSSKKNPYHGWEQSGVLTDKRFCGVTGLAVIAVLKSLQMLQVCGPQLVLCYGVLFGPALTPPCSSVLPLLPAPSTPGLPVADTCRGHGSSFGSHRPGKMTDSGDTSGNGPNTHIHLTKGSLHAPCSTAVLTRSLTQAAAASFRQKLHPLHCG